jgi:hypothetical protein
MLAGGVLTEVNVRETLRVWGFFLLLCTHCGVMLDETGV